MCVSVVWNEVMSLLFARRRVRLLPSVSAERCSLAQECGVRCGLDRSTRAGGGPGMHDSKILTVK